jgi:hypothetical protein
LRARAAAASLLTAAIEGNQNFQIPDDISESELAEAITELEEANAAGVCFGNKGEQGEDEEEYGEE